MKTRFALTVVAAALAAAAECRTTLSPRDVSDPAAEALYFVTNMQPYGQVAALPIAANGTIAGPGTLTQLGSNGPLSNQTLQNALSSSYAVQVIDNLLFAVSGGSNTLNMFEISRSDPTNLTRLGDAVPTAPFPISVAVLPAENLVCVGIGGFTAGISCATYSAITGIGEMDELRPYFSAQNPPPASGQFSEVGSIFFNDKGTALFTAVKGNLIPGALGLGNFLSAFPVANGAVSRNQVISYPDNVSFLYGSTWIPGTDKILTTDLTGAAVFNVNASYQTDTTEFTTPILNNTCTCWATVSATTGTGFVTDPALSRLAEVDLDTGEILKAIVVEPASGLLDLAAARDRLYVLAVGGLTGVPPTVAVFDISGGRGTVRQIQNYNPLLATGPNSAGISVNSQGMALYLG